MSRRPTRVALESNIMSRISLLKHCSLHVLQMTEEEKEEKKEEKKKKKKKK
jgi:hypothetical protein